MRAKNAADTGGHGEGSMSAVMSAPRTRADMNRVRKNHGRMRPVEGCGHERTLRRTRADTRTCA